MDNNRLFRVLKFLPGNISRSINFIGKETIDEINEIVLRKGKPICIHLNGSIHYLGNYGRLYKMPNPDCLCLNAEDLRRVFLSMCQDSVYSYMDNINSGFLTLEGGIRVGISGRFISRPQNENSVRDISTLSIRIAKEYLNISRPMFEMFGRYGLGTTVVIGPPCSGKTTILRDLCRLLSSSYKISLLDERGEISGSVGDDYIFDVGINTDIYTNYQKSSSIEMSIRTMSPQVIILDEVLENAEYEEIIKGLNSGVDFIFSIHANGLDDLLRKSKFQDLLNMSNIKYVVVLNSELNGRISEVYINEDGSNNWNPIDIFKCGNNSQKSRYKTTEYNKGILEFAS